MKNPVAATVSGTLSGEQHKMSFDESGTAHLMSILTNMYGDKAMAVVREYPANAYDSHVQAGNPDPIQVFLPDEWSPNFIVQDYGVGLSKDDLIDVYAKYGKSTKRDTDGQIGGFGIGGKAAFTIAPQFVVTGVKDGERTVAIFALGADGIGNVDIIDHIFNSNEPNGVRVDIAVDDYTAIREAATKLFSTWQPGTVLVDGVQPTGIWDSAFKITDNIYATYGETNGITVVMGGVGYKASQTLLYRLKSGGNVASLFRKIAYDKFHIIAKVNINDADITPSREGLRDTTKTINLLNKILVDYTDGLAEASENYIATAKSPADAAVRLYEKRQFFGDMTAGAVWNGVNLPHKIKLDAVIKPRYARNGKMTASILEERDSNVLLGSTDLSAYTVITGVTKSTESIRRMVARVSDNTKEYYVVGGTSKGAVDWFAWGEGNPVKTITQDALIAKYRELKPAVARGEQVYETNEDPMTVAELLDTKGDIYYVQNGGYSSGHIYDLVAKDATVVHLSSRHSSSALEKKVPGVKPLYTVIKAKAREIFDAITDEDKTAMAFRNNRWADLLIAIADELGDPKMFGEQIDLYRNTRDLQLKGVQDKDIKIAARNILNESFSTVDFENVATQQINKFPLIANGGVGHTYSFKNNAYVWNENGIKHASIYIKAVLDSENQTNKED